MGINSDHIIGFLLGLGGAALGHHLYKKNKGVVDALLKDVKEQVRPAPAADAAFQELSLEDLLLIKDRLEDLIAEKESEETEEAPKAKKKKK